MIRKFIPIICLFIICVFIFTACDEEKEEMMGKDTYKIYGNTLEIALSANPTTGYTWHSEVSDESVISLKDSSYKEDEHESGMTGVGGTQTYIFEGIKEGRCEISLLYYRNWEKEEHTADYLISITVAPDLSVSVENVLSKDRKIIQTA